MVAVSVSVAASYNMVTRAGIQAEQDPAPKKLSQKSLPDSQIQLGLVSRQFCPESNAVRTQAARSLTQRDLLASLRTALDSDFLRHSQQL